MDLETAQITTTAKLPTLKQGEYDMWRLRIEQYFQVQDYALWDVIENGNSFKPAAKTTTNADGTSTTLIPGPVTTEEKVQKKNDMKARSMLLMALPNEHLMTFNQYKDAKTLFAAIQTRFGGNEATKKTQKTLLKQMYENFSAPSTESLDSIFNRLQKIVSQLAILGENISQEDLNLKFLRSLPSEWNTHVVVWRNKPDLDTMSFDDLYNNFKIVEQEKTGRKITINGSDTAGYDKSKVEYFNCHKMRYFVRECRGPRNLDSKNRNQDNSRKTVNVKETSSKAMVAIDGDGSQIPDKSRKGLGFVSYNVVPPPPTGLFLPPNLDLSNFGLEEFQQPKFEGYGPKTSKNVSEDTSNEVRESPNAPMVKKLVSDEKENQRNWNNQKSQQLGSNFVVYNKACFICGSFNHVHANCNYHQRERVVYGNNYTRVNYNYSTKKTHLSAHRKIAPRAVLMKTGLRPLNTGRPVNTAHPKTTVYSARPMSCFSKSSQSTVKRPYQIKTALTNKNFSQKVNTAKGSFYTTRPKAVNTARPNSAVVNVVRENQVNAVKASACWVWRPTKLNSASITLKKRNYVNARGRSKSGTCPISETLRNLMEDILPLWEEPKEGKLLVKELLKQMCDKKNSVLFTDTGCFVLSPDFKLADESHVLLKVPRKNNMYNIDMKKL
ncbi:hypothetical protein Tco_0639137 [Tanacetum coccineum]